MTSAGAARRPSGRPTAAHAAQLAERILDVATRAFLADGYAATSIETIAVSAGIAKRTLYVRWRDKPALFRTVLERLMARWLASPEPPATPAASAGKPRAIPTAIPIGIPIGIPTGNPARNLAGLARGDADRANPVDALASALLQIARRALAVALQPEALALHRLVIAESGRFPELAEMVRQSGAASGVARIAGLLRAEILAGRLATIDPELAAEQFLHLVLTGPQRRALGLAPPLDAAGVESWARQAVALFLHGCRPLVASTES